MAGDYRNFAAKAAPLLFVLLWATGFIGAKLGLPFAEPFTFLSVRMALTLCILAPIVFFFVPDRLEPAQFGHSMVAGLLIHGVYLGGVFFAISRGMPAGVSSLIVALQPIITAFTARLILGERLTALQIAGLAVGLFGVFLVLSPRLSGGVPAEGITVITLLACAISVIGISLGTVYQKRFVSGMDLRASAMAQFLGAFIPLAMLAFLTENMEIKWTGQFLFALAWLVLVLSIGAIALLMWLIRMKSAASTASLFYLVPGVTVLIAYFLFGETLEMVQLLGMIIVMGAVAAASGAMGLQLRIARKR